MTRDSTPVIDFEDIQALVLSGLSWLPSSAYLLIRVVDATAARPWIRGIADQITCTDRFLADFERERPTTALNVAFTFQGLRALGIDDCGHSGFSREFVEGMTAEHRRRILGDRDGSPSDAASWRWGGLSGAAGADHIHVLLLVYAEDPATLERTLADQRSAVCGANVITELRSTLLREDKEHFGFRDGISQPRLRGSTRPSRAGDLIAPGEVLLGYPDETGEAPQGPTVAHAPNLPPAASDKRRADFGRNGTYLVFRQLEQDVEGFWSFLVEFAEQTSLDEASDPILLASKMVGRWPDGTALELRPHRSVSGAGRLPSNEFEFTQGDGARCPLGAHIRRANPRGGLGTDAEASHAFVRRHRLIRRGRPYGLPAEPSVFPEGLEVRPLLPESSHEAGRGLYFISMGSSLERHFEFVQQSWLNNTKFGGVFFETDPLAGALTADSKGSPDVFTIPTQRSRHRVVGMARYVHTIGGAYFFLPSIRSVKFLGEIA